MEHRGSPDAYEHAIAHVHFEGQLIWQNFGTFLLPQTIFVAFLLPEAFGPAPKVGVAVAALLGFLLCIPWYASFVRASDYYRFRMGQAAHLEPPDWNIVGSRGQAFSSGERVQLPNGSTYQIRAVGRVLRTERSVSMLIGAFAVIYLVILAVEAYHFVAPD